MSEKRRIEEPTAMITINIFEGDSIVCVRAIATTNHGAVRLTPSRQPML